MFRRESSMAASASNNQGDGRMFLKARRLGSGTRERFSLRSQTVQDVRRRRLPAFDIGDGARDRLAVAYHRRPHPMGQKLTAYRGRCAGDEQLDALALR